MIKVSKVHHRGSDRFKLSFKYDTQLIQKIKQISNAVWSQTHRAWLLPYTKTALERLKSIEPNVDLSYFEHPKKKSFPVITKEETPQQNKTVRKTAVNPSQKNVKIEVFPRKILINLPKNANDIRFINSLKYSRWNKNYFFWEIPNYPGNLDLIKDYFNQRIDKMVIHEQHDVSINNKSFTLKQNELLIYKTRSGRLRLIFGFDKELINHIKKYPYHSWDSKNKWWTIPFSDHYLKEIKAFSTNKKLLVRFEEEPKQEEGVKRITPYDVPNYRKCPEEMVHRLKEQRYSAQTLKIYVQMFEEFINYYPGLDINNISDKQIKQFLRYLVTERKISTSYQNQSINAIKFYYEKVLGGPRKVYYIDRPKKEKTLPAVLSVEEIKALFASVENIKHKCLLMLAYSSGLRLGEIIRLKIKDIDRERMQIRVVQSKGKKDRYTKLSLRFLQILDEYIEIEKPREYVFEGVKGGQYSPNSAQNIIKAVAQKAGLKKRVTMHTLRHTFATHSLENGVDLRYIQSMMGHESSRTTEIYTHVTTKGFDQIRSPLDDLDI